MNPIRIAGVGAAFPTWTHSNPPDTDTWIKTTLGIANRAFVEHDQTTSSLATEAARQAISNAGITPLQIDLIIVATASPDRIAPATATRVQANLGASVAAAFDLNAVCSGWLYGLTIAQDMLSDRYRNILIVGADTFSRFTDWENRDSVFFGDGAGAVVIQRGVGQFWSHIRSDGAGWDSWSIPGGGSENPDSRPYWEMTGRDVYNHAVTEVPAAVQAVVQHAGYTVDDITMLIPHQASLRVLKEIAARLDLPFEKVATNLWERGNTAAASIPTTLYEHADRLVAGDLVCFAAVGAGWTWGAGLLEWT